MANYTNPKIKFGVVHTSPASLITNAASLEDGKLYFAAGDASGLVKQGIYGVVGVTTDGSIDIDGSGNGKQLAMFGTGAVADGTGYGLSQANFTTDEKNKLAAFDKASTYLTTIDASTNYLKIEDASYFRTVKVGTISIVADSSKDTLEFAAGSNVTITPDESNDKIIISATDTVYTGNDPISVNELIISHANSGVTAGRYGDTSSGRTLEFGGKFKVVDVSVNAFGHVTKASSYELTLPSKPATAGTADMANEAKKTTGTLTIKGNGTSVGTFNGSTAEEVNIKSGNAATLTVTGASDGSITITPVTGAVALNSSALTTGAHVAEYVADVVGELTGALVYKGTVNATNGLPSNASTGWVYVASAGFTYNDGTNDWAVESGDMFIYNGSKWNIVNGENQVSDASATLTPGSTNLKLATVDGTDITVTVPALPSIVNTLNGKSGELTTQYDTSTFTSDSSYRAGTLTIADKTHIIYGKDTVYSHPVSISGTILAESSLNSTSATPLSHEGSFTVATGIYRDASGHISKIATETFKLPSQYSHPAAGTGSVDAPTNSSTAATLLTRVKIDSSGHVTDTTAFNGTVGGTTTPVYFNAGVPTALGYTIATSVPSGAIFTDKNVQDTSGTGKSFILGHATQGSTAAATTNASVYMQSGKMYATSGSVASNDTALVTGGAVYTAVEAAKEAATIYWETL